MLTQTTQPIEQIRAAIASLESEIKMLEALGVEKGSVQAYRNNKHRLMWREQNKVKASPTLDPCSVPEYRAAHKRWLRCQALRRKKQKLENCLYEISSMAIAS